jgi:hypothetical protein
MLNIHRRPLYLIRGLGYRFFYEIFILLNEYLPSERNKVMTMWIELKARIAMALFRVSGDTRQLQSARCFAFDAGMASVGNTGVPSLIQGDPSLLRRWLAGRTLALAEQLEAESWERPCECDDDVGYQCPHHIESSTTRSFYEEAIAAARN